ncbi:MAG TPA: methylated-DNA--[protein]-cysteine S-methyltransferase [Stellaceae bacterium]|nr:methylated-DNA--[protein]-cysteine S-methyltransferase [Stellaceae bacterium]
MTEQSFSLERLMTPTGAMFIVSDDQHRLRAVEWQDHEPRMERLFRRHYGTEGIRLIETAQPSAARRALEAYFAGELDAIDALPTATNGSTFQRKVWDALRQIPVGETISYGTLAARIGQPTAVRAVGLANGANPIAIVVPCHRVIGANASLTGYGGGIERKRWLLVHESMRGALFTIPRPKKAPWVRGGFL